MKEATLKTGASQTRAVEAMAEEVDTTIDKETTEVMAVEEAINHQEEEVIETVVATKIIEEVAMITEMEVAGNRAATIMVEEETTNRMTGMETHMEVIKEASKAQVGVEALSREVDTAAKISDRELLKVLLAMHHLWVTGIRPKGVAQALMSTSAT